MDGAWAIRITDAISITERMAEQIRYLEKDLTEAAGGGIDKSNAREEAYYRLDTPFRAWLASINPGTDDKDETVVKWIRQARHIVLQLGQELATQAGESAFVGRFRDKKWNTAPKALSKFKTMVNLRAKEGVND
jgi:CRISPR system Cascade subunit CasA